MNSREIKSTSENRNDRPNWLGYLFPWIFTLTGCFFLVCQFWLLYVLVVDGQEELLGIFWFAFAMPPFFAVLAFVTYPWRIDLTRHAVPLEGGGVQLHATESTFQDSAYLKGSIAMVGYIAMSLLGYFAAQRHYFDVVWPMGIFIGLGLLVCFTVMICGIRMIVREKMQIYQLTDAVLTLDREPVTLGMPLHVHFEQQLPNKQHFKKVVLTLICEEAAEHDIGAQPRYYKQTVYEETQEIVPKPTLATHLAETVEFDVPATAPPTFESYDHHIHWRLEPRVSIAECDDYKAKYPEIKVIPEMAGDIQPILPPLPQLPEPDETGLRLELEVEPGPLGPENTHYWPVGATICGTVTFVAKEATPSRKMRVELRWSVSGAYTARTDRAGISEAETGDLSAGEKFTHPFEIPIPVEGPISYQGSLIDIRWELIAKSYVEKLLLIEKDLEKIVVPVCLLPAFKQESPGEETPADS